MEDGEEMNSPKWAVIRDCPGQYSFSKWHDSQEAAFKETERLVRLENKVFLIVKLVGRSFIEQYPVKTESYEGSSIVWRQNPSMAIDCDASP
jgi:hypothetical protein